jgi:tetratricopeptide (TPR) repeat protein
MKPAKRERRRLERERREQHALERNRERLTAAEARQEAGYMTEAVLQYAEIFERNRSNPLGDECALKLGFLAFVVNRRNPRAMTEERALAYAQEAQRRHPDNAEIAATLGHLYQRAGRLNEAVHQEEAALSLGPDPERTEEVQWMLGLSLVGMGQVDRARPFFEAAAQSISSPGADGPKCWDSSWRT